MPAASQVHNDFIRRVKAIAPLGLGLSVDVYQPDVIALFHRLQDRRLPVGYFELFKATTQALTSARRNCPSMPMTYHGEGLWVTQPDFPEFPSLQADLTETVSHLAILDSPWLNHECASKQVGGYAFGTYLPPLYTESSARVVAANIRLVQAVLDRRPVGAGTGGPLFLLEVPPLTYFRAGDLSVPAFFRLVTDLAPCGVVLDIGHVWTIHRYSSGRAQTLDCFLQSFLEEFPMERVVEIHVAGLACHAAVPNFEQDGTPAWIDSHAAPIPPALFEMLETVLAHQALHHLRGVALEVDTKPIDLVVEEYAAARQRLSGLIDARLQADQREGTPTCGASADARPPTGEERAMLRRDYDDYARIVTGQQEPSGMAWHEVAEHPEGVTHYHTCYLPHEILHWGGDLADMFPETCWLLSAKAIPLEAFVAWWVGQPRPVTEPYDYFLLKIDRFVEFITQCVPDCALAAQREAAGLRLGYLEASQDILVSPGSSV